MPAPWCEAPIPGVGSRTVTVRPRCAARQAIARPMTPPPTTTTSPSWPAMALTPFAGITRSRFDGRRPPAALSARPSRPPVWPRVNPPLTPGACAPSRISREPPDSTIDTIASRSAAPAIHRAALCAPRSGSMRAAPWARNANNTASKASPSSTRALTRRPKMVLFAGWASAIELTSRYVGRSPIRLTIASTKAAMPSATGLVSVVAHSLDACAWSRSSSSSSNSSSSSIRSSSGSVSPRTSLIAMTLAVTDEHAVFLGCRRIGGLERDLRRDSVQPLRQIPVPVADDVHHRRHKDRPQEERVEENGAGKADTEQLDRSLVTENKAAEYGDHDQCRRRDDAARLCLADDNGVPVIPG